MPYYNPFGDYPQIGKNTFIHPSAQVIGNVVIGENCFVGPNAVIRADEALNGKVSPIIIGNKVNIQDGVIIHALAGTEVRIHDNVSIAHGAIVHGPAVIKEYCFIGFGAVVFNAVLNPWVFVGHRAVVEECEIASERLVPTGIVVRDQILQKLTESKRDFILKVNTMNVYLVEKYLKK